MPMPMVARSGAQTVASRSAGTCAPDDIIPQPTREFAFSDEDFQALARFAYEKAGIVLAQSKSNLVYSRLSRRLRTLGITAFRDYRRYLDENAAESESFVNAISTNLTKFFREPHHFDHFAAQIAAPHARGSTGQRLRVWSAGCSTGEEAYTIVMVLHRACHGAPRGDVKILASDIDTQVLAKAAAGLYPASALDDVPADLRAYFPAIGDSARAEVGAAPALRALIAFRRLNLLEPWPFSGLFDAIFCRNVMIYFDAPTRTALVERFTQQLRPGGWLYIGHSESLIGPHPGLEVIGRTIYRRRA